MQMKNKKLAFRNVWIVLGVIVFILIVTNPSKKDFDQYLGTENKIGGLIIRTHRVKNYFLFGYYEYNLGDKQGVYFAILGNFYLREGLSFHKVLDDIYKD